MVKGMRADFMTGSQPLPDLDLIHQTFRDFAFGHVPLILLTEESGNQELDGAKMVARQNLQARFEDVGATVIESDHSFRGLMFVNQRPLVKLTGAVAGQTQGW